MRLTCPNCGAQYEIPLEAIPLNGRDVQCSNCRHTWFQNRPDDQPVLAKELILPQTPRAAPEPETPAPPAEPQKPVSPQVAPTPPALADRNPDEDEDEEDARPDQQSLVRATIARPRPMDPKVADVLREEAAHESRQRTGAIASPQRPSTTAAPSAPPILATPEPAAASRRGLLPDAEEIQQTMLPPPRPKREFGAQNIRTPIHIDEPRSGFGRGFLIVIILAVFLGATYALAPQISDALPVAKPLLTEYVAAVDQARLWLDAQASAILNSSSSDAPAPAGS
ncbi:hypothetical protein P775_22475 [Puniceibacterium antarcticum]|uniref:Zinc finger/thioredoxin putative domain-containing protein n=1 Tax=Puniceibacterium antarcticum TaxID=1206336 RepID=A0A2G8R8N9_9RHOB|nr:zinc-ribbon domain-containing protein [Puniceibacterium antarcticum]PIL17925.1 hypothetical protein P775_22475 [Puniceibacterium antarcticum]